MKAKSTAAILFASIALIALLGCVEQPPATGIDYSCTVDSDCEIKNVGNLCGGYPECVNKNFVPNPPELDSMICGFPSIDGCKCIAGKCEGTFSGDCKCEGETIPVIANPPACCTGLELIPPKEENWVGIMGYCTAKCGNGICDEATESNYNCPLDCPVAEAQDYYNSEQEAYDALAEELDGLEEPSGSDLEEMLGQ